MYETRQVDDPYGFALFKDGKQLTDVYKWPEAPEILRCIYEDANGSDEYSFWNDRLRERIAVWNAFWKIKGFGKPIMGRIGTKSGKGA